MRRRRRTKYTWFPNVGTAGADNIDNSSGRQFGLNVNANGSTNVLVGTLTFDNPIEGDNVSESDERGLINITGNEYFIRRIVGKLYIEHNGVWSPNGDPSEPQHALVGAGFFIARASDSDTGGPAQPIGAGEIVAGISGVQESYNPLAEDCIREPWIWRRTWILKNGSIPAQGSDRTVTQTSVTADGRPNNTAAYGSVLDGPHIDAKTARRVRQDERLWFAVACRDWPLQGAEKDQSSALLGYLDYRILGAMRKARNRGSF